MRQFGDRDGAWPAQWPGDHGPFPEDDDFTLDRGDEADFDLDGAIRKALLLAAAAFAIILIGAAGYYVFQPLSGRDVTILANS